MTYFVQHLSQKAYTLRLPRHHTNDVQRYVRQHQTSVSLENAPFRRQLDFWFFSIAIALARELSPLDGPSSQWGKKFVDTRQVDMSEGSCNLLAVIAFHYLGAEHDRINDPAQIIEIGNCLAGAGCPKVLKQLNSRDLRLTPLEKTLHYATSTLSEMSSHAQTNHN